MIEVNRNSITIRDVDFESTQFKKFERAFSLYDPVTHRYTYSIFDIVGTDIHLPATINIHYIESFFPEEKIMENYITPTAMEVHFKMIHEPRDQIQVEALSFLQTIKFDKKTKTRMLNLRTGSGKTFVSISLLSSLEQRAMIVVDTIDLANQWKKEILFHTNLKEENILILSGRESVEKAKDDKKIKIFIAMHKTLGMLLDDDLNSLNSLMYSLKIGVRVFDECHVNFKGTCMINSLSNVNYTIFLTATPNRSDYKDDILYQKVYEKVPSYDGNKSENEKYHTVIITNFNSHPTNKEIISVKTKYGFSMMKWANFLKTDDCYQYYIASLIQIIKKFNFIENKVKAAVMLPTIDLINKTKEDLELMFPDLKVGRYIGEIKKDQRTQELNNQIILTDIKIFGKAMDVPDLDCVVNYLQMSSAVNVEQMIGRLRNNPGHSHVLIDVTDNGYAPCINQGHLRKRVYKKLAKTILETNMKGK